MKLFVTLDRRIEDAGQTTLIYTEKSGGNVTAQLQLIVPAKNGREQEVGDALTIDIYKEKND